MKYTKHLKKLLNLSIALALSYPVVYAGDGVPPFSWDTVPTYAHLANRSDDFTPEQLDFLAEHFDFITIEKGQATRKHGSMDKGFAIAAKGIKQRNPKAKVLCYTWGYQGNDTGTFEWYPELDKPLGPPQGDAQRTGWQYRREFAHASVFVDIETGDAEIQWKK